MPHPVGRDTARYFDCCNGFDRRDPLSLPVVGGWEAALGSFDLSGMTVAILPDLGTARVRTEVADVSWRPPTVSPPRRGCDCRGGAALPPLRGQWAMAGQPAFVADLGDAYPDRIDGPLERDARGPEARRSGSTSSGQRGSSATGVSSTRPWRTSSTGRLRDVLDQPRCRLRGRGAPAIDDPRADLINELGFSRAIMNTAALTAPSNINGSPAMSIPAGRGRPAVGLQVLAGHHREQLLLDLALVAEREIPWPRGAGSPL